METIISNEDRVAIAEVDYIIHHMNIRYLNMIPQNVQDYITILKKRNINIYVDPHKPLEQQGLKEFTLYFLMILNLKYWCDDIRRREILTLLEENERKYDDKINNIFDNAETLQGDNSRPLNRPRQVIVTGAPTFPNKNANNNEDEEISASDNIEENEKNEAIANIKNESFLKKIVNKFKKFLIKK